MTDTIKKVHGGSFFTGFASFFRAFGFILKTRGMGRYFIIPFLLNIIVLVTVFLISYDFFSTWFSGLFTGDAWYMTVLRALLKPVLFILISIITILVYSITGCIVTAPFNDFLSKKVEMEITGERFDDKFRISVFIGDVLRIFFSISLLVLIILLLNIVLFLLNLIPAFGQAAYAVLSFLTASFFIGYQFFDFPLERRRIGFSRKLWITWRHKWMVMGLGAAFFLVSYIPIIGFLGLNCATIGGTMLFIEHMKDESLDPGSPGRD